MKKSLCKTMILETNDLGLLSKGVEKVYNEGYRPISGMITSRPDSSIVIENKYRQVCVMTIKSFLEVKEMLCLTNAVGNKVSLVNLDNVFHPLYNTNFDIQNDLKIASFDNQDHQYDNVVKIDNHYFTYILQSYVDRRQLGIVFDRLLHHQNILNVNPETGHLTVRISVPNNTDPKEKPSSTELCIKLTSVITDAEWR